MRDWRMACCWAVVVLGGLVNAARADSFDLHWFWDQRCADCHGHAGTFARTALTVENGRLVGRHHRDDLMLFLGNHGVPAARVKPLHDMLLAQATAGARFKEKCGDCHESAAELVRESVVLRDGVVSGRETGRPMADFLKRHGKLAPDDVPFFVELLTRVEREVRSPY
ncbi:MAG TPA: hypothetical protein VD860_04975 [Azospirillum sp.]|nr:hypothetical protein [Azospirillum sp.]